MQDLIPHHRPLARATAALRSRALLVDWGVTVASAEAGRVTLQLALPSEGAGSAGRFADPAHGAVDRSILVALGEAACWLAVVSRAETAGLIATLEMKVDLIATQCPFEVLEASGDVQRLGRSISAVCSTVVGRDPHGGRHKLCLVQATMLARDNEE